jgi:hypothetical protein
MAKKKNQPGLTGFIELDNKALEVVEYKVPKSIKKKAETVVEAVVEPVADVVVEPVVETEPVMAIEEVVVSEPSSEPTE